MSLREALRATVACCTPQGMQHATIDAKRATDDATRTQQPADKPRKSSLCDATGDATSVQQPSCTGVAQGTGIRPRSCTSCRHRSRYGTCLQPVEAGLAKRFSIRWPEPGHAATCAAWRRDPYEAQTMVLIESARRNWSAIERNAWLADADADPAAVLEVLHGWRGGPRGGRSEL